MSDNTFPINKWYNRRVPTLLGILIVSLAGTIAGFVIVQIDATLPSGHVSPIFTPRFGEVSSDSDWQTYVNTLGGYEVMYPINCDITISNKKILAKDCGSIEVFDHDFEKDWSIEQFMSGVDTVYSNQEEFYINGYKGIKADYNGVQSGKSAVIKKDDVFYNIYIPCDKFGDSVEECSQVFDQTLSNFKFIESIDIPDWQVYRSKEFGLEFKYPATLLDRYEWQLVPIGLTEMHIDLDSIEKRDIEEGYTFATGELMNNYMIDVSVYENTASSEADFYTNIDDYIYDLITDTRVLKDIEIENMKWQEISYKDRHWVEVWNFPKFSDRLSYDEFELFLPSGNFIYNFSYYSIGAHHINDELKDAASKEGLEIFKKILSSFKIID